MINVIRLKIGDVNYEKVANDYWETVRDTGARFGCSTQIDLMLTRIYKLEELLRAAQHVSLTFNPEFHREDRVQALLHMETMIAHVKDECSTIIVNENKAIAKAFRDYAHLYDEEPQTMSHWSDFASDLRLRADQIEAAKGSG